MEMQTVTVLRQMVEVVKTQVRKRTARWLEYEEGARYHRCEIAAQQALNDLERIKTSGRVDSLRNGFTR
ncbi:MAG: hypothetical protein ACFFD3_07230 [Candidatus Thorarchaeota archaeon]